MRVKVKPAPPRRQPPTARRPVGARPPVHLYRLDARAVITALVGLHRYEVAQGFGPKVRRLTGATAAEVLDRASAIMGSEPVNLWDSADNPEWDGPHAVWASWA
jgi:hypothetical protein